MPYPDNFSSAAYANAYERPILREPPLNVADHDDIEALVKYRAACHAAHDILKFNRWTFDSTEIPLHEWLLADSAAFLRQIDLAIAEAMRSREAVS